MQSFRVLADEQVVATSDHNVLVCTVSVPRLGRTRQARHEAAELFVKWDESRGEDYRRLLASAEYAQRRGEVVLAMQQGLLSVGEASDLGGGGVVGCSA